MAVAAGFGGAFGTAAGFGEAVCVAAAGAHFEDGRPRLGAAEAADARLDAGALRLEGAPGQIDASWVGESSSCTSA